MRKLAVLPATVLLLAACASTSTTPTTTPATAKKKASAVDQNEPRRVVGTENNVRIDAEVFGDQLAQSITLPIRYDITNNREAAIAIADLIPEVNYDEDARTVTISIGSEVPGEQLLPRLIKIAPGEKKSFSAVARVNLLLPTGTPASHIPRQLQLKLNFLDDTAQFERLIAMTEKGLNDPKLADELFPKWLERNETVYTNALPMRWQIPPIEETPIPTRRGKRRG